MSLKQDLETCNLFFVYGTLRIGYSNHRIFGEDRVYLGDAATEDNFYMLGDGVPVITRGGDKKVFGEIYRVKKETTMEALDRLEGHPTLYKREVIKVKDEDGETHDAWCYVYARDISHPYPHLGTHEVFGEIQTF